MIRTADHRVSDRTACVGRAERADLDAIARCRDGVEVRVTLRGRHLAAAGLEPEHVQGRGHQPEVLGGVRIGWQSDCAASASVPGATTAAARRADSARKLRREREFPSTRCRGSLFHPRLDRSSGARNITGCPSAPHEVRAGRSVCRYRGGQPRWGDASPGRLAMWRPWTAFTSRTRWSAAARSTSCTRRGLGSRVRGRRGERPEGRPRPLAPVQGCRLAVWGRGTSHLLGRDGSVRYVNDDGSFERRAACSFLQHNDRIRTRRRLGHRERDRERACVHRRLAKLQDLLTRTAGEGDGKPKDRYSQSLGSTFHQATIRPLPDSSNEPSSRWKGTAPVSVRTSPDEAVVEDTETANEPGPPAVQVGGSWRVSSSDWARATSSGDGFGEPSRRAPASPHPRSRSAGRSSRLSAPPLQAAWRGLRKIE